MKRPRSEPVPDAELVVRFQQDPESSAGREALGELFRRYRDRLYHWCYRYVRDHDAAMDLVQETYVAAWRALPGFEGRSQFGSWLFSIARFRCASARRRPQVNVEEDHDLATTQDSGPGPEETLLEQEDEAQVLAFLSRHLEDQERLAFWLRCYEGVGVDEITSLLGIREKTGARAVLQRARRKLRAALAESRGDLSPDREGKG